MTRVTKKAERLARALVVVASGQLSYSMAFDRAHWCWPEFLEKAQAIIDAQNLLEYFEDTRPLHGCVEDAKADQGTYDAHYTGPGSHEQATNIVHGLEGEADDA